MTATPRDPGLQPERTALAWQRSALALAVATIVVGRLTFSTVGLVALLVVALGLGHTAVIFATAHRHYRMRTGAQQANGMADGRPRCPAQPPGGRPRRPRATGCASLLK